MRVILLSLLASLVCVAPMVCAHEMRPAYLELREVSSDTYDVIWKVPARGSNEKLSLHVRFSDDVEVLGEPVSAFMSEAFVQRWRVQRAGGLTGSTVTIDGLASTFTDALLRFERADGTALTHRFTADNPAYIIEASPSLWQVTWTYLMLGIEHILLGIDHLLFVLALLLLVKGQRKLVLTITAFTVAHSITLALTALGFVSVPGPPVEAFIALSIVFAAAEIVHGCQEKPGLTAQWPWIVAFTFGLLHGFGFAGALAEVGLPQKAIPLALLFFNVGVEIGQLAFVFAVFACWAVIKRIKLPLPSWAWRIPPYAIGSIAAYWLIERTLGFWGA